MNTNDITQFVQKGFHITLGAASLVADSIQSAEKRDEAIAKVNRGDFNTLSEELAVEGAKKDLEARQFVETLVGQMGGGAQTSGASGFSSPSSKSSSPAVPSTIVEDLKILTIQLASIREDLEKNRES
jgi:hypothetical protein